MNIKELLNKEIGNKKHNKIKVKTLIGIFIGILLANFLIDLF